MNPEKIVIQGPYFQDLLKQPQAIKDTLAGLEADSGLPILSQRLSRKDYDRVLLTGMGSSFHALHPLSLRLVEQGFTPLMLETSELNYYYSPLLNPRTLIVAVSQSGESIEMVRLLELNQRKSPVIAVTNTPNSTLARHSDATVLTCAGAESTVSCKTYVAALTGLIWLGEFLGQSDLSRSRQEMEKAAFLSGEYLGNWNGHAGDLINLLQGIRNVFLVGRGSSLAATGTGGLIVKESTHLHAEGMSTAAFRHGPMEMLDSRTFVLVFAGEPATKDLNRRLWEDIRSASGVAGWVGPDATQKAFRLPETSSIVRPLLEILPVQMMTLALAALAGREAGRFERAQKITTTE